MRILILLVFMAAVSHFDIAEASWKEKATALANCAWEQTPASALVLLEEKPRKRSGYGFSSDRLAPYMRVYAACLEQRIALKNVTDEDDFNYRLLKAVRKAKPKQVSDDIFNEKVFRCIASFSGKEMSGPPLVWWGFGEDTTQKQLGEQARIFNSQIEITLSDIAALEKRGDGSAKLAAKIKASKTQEVGQFEKYDDGINSGKAFKIKPSTENSVCKFVNPDGSLSDA